MSQPETVQQAQVSPAVNPEDSKRGREISTIDFPYNDLDDAVGVAKAVHRLGGNECRLEALAAELGHDTVKSGGFRQKLSSAHVFGLTSLSQGIVSLSDLGAKIVDAEQEKAKRAEAFLKVPLYSAIYEEFKSGTLPPPPGLETKMVSLGVASKQKDKARQVFQRSAKQAGFFAYGTTKLVYPSFGNTPAKPKESETPPANGSTAQGGSGGGGGNGSHPLIDGLIKALPKPGERWPLDARRKWLQAAAMNFDYVYADEATENRTIRVSVEAESSAK